MKLTRGLKFRRVKKGARDIKRKRLIMGSKRTNKQANKASIQLISVIWKKKKQGKIKIEVWDPCPLIMLLLISFPSLVNGRFIILMDPGTPASTLAFSRSFPSHFRNECMLSNLFFLLLFTSSLGVLIFFSFRVFRGILFLGLFILSRITPCACKHIKIKMMKNFYEI